MRRGRLSWLNWLLLAGLVALLATAVGQTPAMRASPKPSHLENVRLQFEGYISQMAGSLWSITNSSGQVDVTKDELTVVKPIPPATSAELFDWVLVTATHLDGQPPHADVITVQQPASQGAPKVQLAGQLTKKTFSEWVLDGKTTVVISGKTVLPPGGEPPINSLISVLAEQDVYPDNHVVYYGLLIHMIAATPQDVPVEFQGIVSVVNETQHYWTVDDSTVRYDPVATKFDAGLPVVGDKVQVWAEYQPDTTLMALRVSVVKGPAAQPLGVLVLDIADQADGSQVWTVVAFPADSTLPPEAATLHVERPTLVDQSRATARQGRWAEVQAVPSGAGSYRAESVRVAQPVSVTIRGVAAQDSAGQSGGRWLNVEGQRVWVAPSTQASAALEAAGAAVGTRQVMIDGRMLGNGVVWADQVSLVDSLR